MSKFYTNPNNPEIKVSVGQGFAWWVLIFGAFWFWTKGMVARGFFWWAVAIITLGIAWIIAPFFAFAEYEKHLIEKGYKVAG